MERRTQIKTKINVKGNTHTNQHKRKTITKNAKAK